jgi:CrcB protein
MMAYLWVALGSALGGMARYGAGMAAARLWGIAFPWGTILINVAGSFIIAFFGALTLPGGPLPASAGLRVFVMVGLCGGFTTFSSFSLQTLELARNDAWGAAFLNVALSVALCLLAAAAGYLLAARIGLAAQGEP